jgi:hypothetical protein
MTCARVKINIVLVAISASYLTMGVANPDLASSLWWVYALASGLLSSLNLWLAHRADKRARLRAR